MTNRPGLVELALFTSVVLGCGYSHVADFETPTAATRLELRDASNRLLWRLDGNGATTVSLIDYGVVPSGYSQVFPPSGAPRQLVPGESLLLVYVNEHGGKLWWRQHWGNAVGQSAFKGGVWRGGPLNDLPLEDIFVDGERPISDSSNWPPG